MSNADNPQPASPGIEGAERPDAESHALAWIEQTLGVPCYVKNKNEPIAFVTGSLHSKRWRLFELLGAYASAELSRQAQCYHELIEEWKKEADSRTAALRGQLEQLQAEHKRATENHARWRTETDEQQKLMYTHLAEDITKTLKRLKVWSLDTDDDGKLETSEMQFDEAWNLGYRRGMYQAAQHEIARKAAESSASQLRAERESAIGVINTKGGKYPDGTGVAADNWLENLCVLVSNYNSRGERLQQATDDIAAAERDRDSLREALEKYGNHLKTCNVYRQARTKGTDGIWRDDPCNCGFSAALTPTTKDSCK